MRCSRDLSPRDDYREGLTLGFGDVPESIASSLRLSKPTHHIPCSYHRYRQFVFEFCFTRASTGGYSIQIVRPIDATKHAARRTGASIVAPEKSIKNSPSSPGGPSLLPPDYSSRPDSLGGKSWSREFYHRLPWFFHALEVRA